MRLSGTLLNNQDIIEEIKDEIKIHRNKWQWKHDDPKPMGHNKSSSKMEVYGNSISPQEVIKTPNEQSNLTPEGARKERNPKVTRRKEIIKIREEINGTETKKTIRRINENKSSFSEKIKFTNP